jgi:hypothetical protein
MGQDTGTFLNQSGRITPDQIQTHIEHQFEVSPGTTLIEIDFDYAPKMHVGSAFSNEISLSLYDPFTGRGARHNNPDQHIFLKDMAASKGYLPGPLHSGIWTVSIDVHRIMSPDDVDYWLSIRTDNMSQTAPALPFFPSPCNSCRPGWYRGDLHGHTLHSDASWGVPEFVDYARQRKLDFVTLTDHNTTSGVAECLSLADDDLLVMGGAELTTFWGHCLTIGGQDYVDWRITKDRSMGTIAGEEIEKGKIFIIAHPTCAGFPHCSGCDWKYRDVMPGVAKVVEVWNGDWPGIANNDAALSLYYCWLSLGHRLVATAGSDIHAPFGKEQRPGYNVVQAEALSEDAICTAIQAGRLYLSSGPTLAVTDPDGENGTLMGQELPISATRLLVEWDVCPEDAIVYLKRPSDNPVYGVKSDVIGCGVQGMTQVPIYTRLEHDWAVVEIRDALGALHCLSNPVFLKNLEN